MAQLQDPFQDIPSVDIDITQLSLASYVGVMDWAHARDLERAAGNLYANVPITSNVPGWRRINLLNPGLPTLSLIIDEINGYLTGFSRDNGGYMRFDDLYLPNNVQGTPLGVKSSYLALMKIEQCGTLLVGKPIFENIYHALVNYDETLSPNHPRMKAQKKALAQLILMLCEALRFIVIYNMICGLMDSYDSVPLPFNMWNLIKNWSTLSRFALHCQEKETLNEPLDTEMVKTVAVLGIHNRQDILGALRLILGRY